jgi:uncharacterized protein YdhG (YjbR/CyaY superfamily)
MVSEEAGVRAVDEYIAGFPEEVRVVLEEVRRVIREAAPEAEEGIKYQLPTFMLKGNLVHFGAFKKHIGFYPTPSGIETFKEEFARYQGAKGSLRFPLDEPMPLALIAEVVRFRVKENLERAAAKGKKR